MLNRQDLPQQYASNLAGVYGKAADEQRDVQRRQGQKNHQRHGTRLDQGGVEFKMDANSASLRW